MTSHVQDWLISTGMLMTTFITVPIIIIAIAVLVVGKRNLSKQEPKWNDEKW